MSEQEFNNLKIGDIIHFNKIYINDNSGKATIIKYDKKNNEYIALDKETNTKLFINKFSYWRFKI